jgi:hypothetical protein
MSKKRAIISYDKMDIEQKKQLLVAFPDGFSEGMTQIKTPTGETLDALLWETEEVIYLVKIPKPSLKTKPVDEDEDDFDEELPKFDDVKGEEDEFSSDDDADDDYDVADEEDEAEEDEDE